MREHVPIFEEAGFVRNKVFFQAGLFYVENGSYAATGTFGSSVVTIKCKVRDCDNLTTGFESVIISLNEAELK